jgi:60 kDa SS-A/Ro ribonucleoprotein
VTRDPLASISTRATPQSQPADPRQVPNSAGGFTFTLGQVERLRRFLVLGVDGGTFYAKPPELALDNAQVVIDMTSTPESHTALVDEITRVSVGGRAPRQQPALFALAIAASNGTDADRRNALSRLHRVARTGTHLFQFVTYAQQFRGWGPLMREFVGAWYTAGELRDLTYQVVKYRQRDGWTHRDVLRRAHPVPVAGDEVRRGLFDWVCGRPVPDAVAGDDQLRLVEGLERVQRVTDPRVAAQLVGEYGLTWEMLPDIVINSPVVWDALLVRGVPQTALVRQLPRLTRLGLLAPTGNWATRVAAQLTDPERLKRARVHPLSVLVAQRTYASGRSDRGSSTWVPSRPIVDALDAAFYAAFGAVEPTGRRLMLALDVSASMTWTTIMGAPITPRDASAALALVTAATESRYELVAFSGGSWQNASIAPLAISPRQRLDDAIRVVSRTPAGGTDCALPMLFALENNLQIDTFVIYTDNETWAGRVHPHEALRRYRERTGIPARLVVVGMTATGFTIADPTDPGMLDVVGFDAATPTLISNFARGEV